MCSGATVSILFSVTALNLSYLSLADSGTLHCNISDQFIFSSAATNFLVLSSFKLHVLNSTGPIFFSFVLWYNG